MVAVAEDKAGKAHHEIKFILKRRRELTSENNRLRANNAEITERNRELERENQRLRAQLEAPTCSFCLVNVAVRPLAGCGHRVCCNDPQCVAGSSHHQWRRCFVCNALRAEALCRHHLYRQTAVFSNKRVALTEKGNVGACHHRQ
jgi:FtsZ-binding cell division protein ZapB